VVFVTPIMDPYVCTISGSAAVCLRSPTSDISLLVMSFESRTVHLRVLAAMSVTSGTLQNPPFGKSAIGQFQQDFSVSQNPDL